MHRAAGVLWKHKASAHSLRRLGYGSGFGHPPSVRKWGTTIRSTVSLHALEDRARCRLAGFVSASSILHIFQKFVSLSAWGGKSVTNKVIFFEM
jgi:hypothetical protein